ncbi:MAG: hypothetical protein ACYTEQ_30335 [Planctomycetota bacterium]|jgi:hypothetical protein
MVDAFTGANVLCGIATVYTGTAGATATTHAGYTKDGAEVAQAENANFIFVDNVDAAIKKCTVELECQVTMNIAESTLANMALPQAVTNATQTNTLSGTSTNTNLSIKLVGTNPAGFDRTWEFLQARPRGDLTTSYVKGEVQMVSVVFDCLYDETSGFVGTMVDAIA